MSEGRIASWTCFHDRVTPQQIGSAYEFWDDDTGALFRIDYLHPHSKGIDAWCEIWWNGPGPPESGVKTFGRFDLMGARTVSTLAKQAAAKTPIPEARWNEILTSSIYDVIQGYLLGDKPVFLDADLDDVEEATPRWLLRPFVSGSGATSLVAPGGSSKSYLSLAISLAIATGNGRVFGGMKPMKQGPVLYLDWEDTEAEHRKRMAALMRGADMTEQGMVIYRQERAPLYRSIVAVEKLVARYGVVLVVIDSVMLARGGDAFSPEATLMLFDALRQLGVPALLIQHKSLEAMRKKLRGSYGSVVNDNSARLVWEATGVVASESQIDARWEVTKRNNMPPLDPLGLRIEFDNQGDILRSVKIRQVAATVVKLDQPEVPHDAPLWQRMWAALGGERMTTKQLAQEVGVGEEMVRTTARRYPDRFINVGSEHSAVWAAAGVGTLDMEAVPDPF